MTPTATALPQTARWDLVRTVALGLALGAAAFIPDLMTEEAAPYATPLVSSGFAWGLVALYAGYCASTRRSAALGASTALTLAAVVYYGLILFVSQRWLGTVEATEDGLLSDAGLDGIARSLVLWIVCGAVGGAIAGSLGRAVRMGRTWLRSVSAGLAAGLLSGEACFTLIRVESIWSGPLDAFDLSKLVPSLAQILLTVVTMALLLARHRRALSKRLFIVATVLSLTASVVLWYAVYWARIAIY